MEGLRNINAVRPPPQVSVVMPSYNQGYYIEEAIRSVFDEAERHSLELIVMDGGSTDGTQEILYRLTREAPGVLRWVSEKDWGPAHAINKALDVARGQIIGWLNADDYYTPGAVARAIAAFTNHPDWLMVYGHGEHVDALGYPLGSYPTKTPTSPMGTFAEGCFICQPTVFLRKDAIRSLGRMDESLRTAFDFEYWLRLFNLYPGRVGFIDAVQAYSRLHEESITLGQRETVIREGMQLLAQYLGAAPLTWFRTYVDEFLAKNPLEKSGGDIFGYISAFSESVRPFLDPADQSAMGSLLREDARIQLAQAHAYLNVHPDGWMPPETTIDIRTGANLRFVELKGRYEFGPPSLRLSVLSPNGEEYLKTVDKKRRFTLRIPLSKQLGPSRPQRKVERYLIRSSDTFIPSQVDVCSNDERELAWQVEEVRVCRGNKFIRWALNDLYSSSCRKLKAFQASGGRGKRG